MQYGNDRLNQLKRFVLSNSKTHEIHLLCLLRRVIHSFIHSLPITNAWSLLYWSLIRWLNKCLPSLSHAIQRTFQTSSKLSILETSILCSMNQQWLVCRNGLLQPSSSLKQILAPMLARDTTSAEDPLMVFSGIKMYQYLWKSQMTAQTQFFQLSTNNACICQKRRISGCQAVVSSSRHCDCRILISLVRTQWSKSYTSSRGLYVVECKTKRGADVDLCNF